MFGNVERDREIAILKGAVAGLHRRTCHDQAAIREINSRHASLVRDVADTEDAIKLILEQMGMEVVTIHKHKELMSRGTASPE